MNLGEYIPRAKLLRTQDVRGFVGGWNTEDDDKVLSPEYSTRALNIRFDNDGTPSVRYGTVPFAEVGEPIVDVFYFGNAFVVVASSGNIYSVDLSGTVNQVWSGWSATQFVSFVPFNGKLYIHNGVDKPLEMQGDFTTDFSRDPVDLSNTNTPIGKYAIAAGRYHVVAGDPNFPQRIHISSRDAPATWYGDSEPNDGTFIDVGFALAQASEIKGLLWFRNRLLVLFPEGVVVGTLGIYNEDNEHVPDFTDAIEGYGCVAHRTAIARGDDGFFVDYVGLNSLRRTVFNDTIKPEQASENISTELTNSLAQLTVEQFENQTFSVMDTLNGEYLLFLPNGRIFVLGLGRRYRWSEFSGWNFTCGTRSITGLIVFGDAQGRLWYYGNDSLPVLTDNGQPIQFDWELPWLPFTGRNEAKNLKYVAIDARGQSEFTLELYCDDFLHQPMAAMGFSGGDQGGFGNGPQPYGGGRNTNYQKLWAVTGKFKVLKPRIRGESDAGLSIIGLSFTFQQGTIRR